MSTGYRGATGPPTVGGPASDSAPLLTQQQQQQQQQAAQAGGKPSAVQQPAPSSQQPQQQQQQLPQTPQQQQQQAQAARFLLEQLDFEALPTDPAQLRVHKDAKKIRALITLCELLPPRELAACLVARFENSAVLPVNLLATLSRVLELPMHVQVSLLMAVPRTRDPRWMRESFSFLLLKLHPSTVHDFVRWRLDDATTRDLATLSPRARPFISMGTNASLFCRPCFVPRTRL